MSKRAGKVEPQGQGKPPPLLPKPTLNVRATLDAARSTRGYDSVAMDGTPYVSDPGAARSTSEGLREAELRSGIPLAKWLPSGKAGHLTPDDYADLDAARSTSEGLKIICGAKHPNGKTTCRRQPGHDDDHGTARLDVTWAAALGSEDEG